MIQTNEKQTPVINNWHDELEKLGIEVSDDQPDEELNESFWQNYIKAIREAPAKKCDFLAALSVILVFMLTSCVSNAEYAERQAQQTERQQGMKIKRYERIYIAAHVFCGKQNLKSELAHEYCVNDYVRAAL